MSDMAILGQRARKAGFSGVTSSGTGAPVLSAARPGNLIVAAIQRNAATPSRPSPGGWREWAVAGDGAPDVSASFWWKIAQSAAESWETWSHAGRRWAWIFPGGLPGEIAIANVAATTALVWPKLIDGNPFPYDAVVCGALFCRTAQAAFTGIAPAALPNVGFSNAASGAFACEGHPLRSFGGAAASLATASAYSAVTFSIRGL